MIASDGLFGFVTTEVAAQIAQGYTWPEDAVVALMRHVSITYGILDDTSIIVVDVVGSGNRRAAGQRGIPYTRICGNVSTWTRREVFLSQVEER